MFAERRSKYIYQWINKVANKSKLKNVIKDREIDRGEKEETGNRKNASLLKPLDELKIRIAKEKDKNSDDSN